MTTKEFQKHSLPQIFVSYFKPHRRLFFLDIACALVMSLIDLAFPFVSRWCMYTALPADAWQAFSGSWQSWWWRLLSGRD